MADDTSAPDAPREVPDLGFFAGSPQTGSSQFGAAPSAFGGAVSSRFGGPAAPATIPAPSQFGAPTQFGNPGFAVASPPPGLTGQARSGGTWKVVAAAAAAVVLIAGFFGGRLFWQQFVADPVVPDTLAGMPRLLDVDAEADMGALQDGLMSELGVGGDAEIAFYTSGQGAGYMLVSVRGGYGMGDGGDEASTDSWTESQQGDATCYSKAAQAAQGVGVTFCYQGFWRRGVVVMGFGATQPEAATVARATNEAWDAQ